MNDAHGTNQGAAGDGTSRPESPPERTVAILQSNYIPWKGYFDLIRRADLFVIYDEVQYTRRDWRNRNRIKTSSGVQWLTIPVEVAGRYEQTISRTRVADPGWAERHWKTLVHSYRRAACFNDVAPRLEAFYRGVTSTSLSAVNEELLRLVCAMLGIATPLRQSREFRFDEEDPTARLVSICAEAGATRYLSGPAARAYLDESKFAAAGIAVDWMSYEGYPSYPQLHGEFDHRVSVVDLLFNTGARASDYLLPLREPEARIA